MGAVPIFHADVAADGCTFIWQANEAALRRGYLKQLAGQRIDVVLRAHRERRSDRQNKWHWGIAIPLIAHHLGYDKHEHDEVHYALVAECFGVHIDRVTGREIPNVRSSKLSTVQFSELMEWEVRWAATEHGIVIPLPNEAEAA